MLAELYELKKMQEALNAKYFEGKLPEAFITIQAKVGEDQESWFWANKWKDDEGNLYHEINICAETLNTGKLNIMGAMLHSMIHLYCYENDIPATSSLGRYHNRRFQAEAVRRDLLTERTEAEGHSITKPTVQFQEFVEQTDVKDIFNVSRIYRSENLMII